jgi:light-regulated signal transduction histidine kinase (bacteriophytochrome)
VGDVVGQLCWKTLQSGMTGPCDFCTSPLLLAADGTPNDTYTWENFNPALGCWYQRHDCAIPWSDGRIVRMQIALDITVRKQAEASLHEIAQELLRSNSELEQFSYSISHDMRQPLRMISSYLQLLQSGLGDTLDAEKREYFNFAIDGAQRLDAMLRGLLDYSRIGRKGEPPALIDSRTALDEALLFLRPAIAEAQAELRIEGEWPRILASTDELLRLLQNLIGNALKFRVEGRPPVVTVSSEVINGHWRFCVADNGVGILPDQIGRLFQVFQRLQSRIAFEGTGIGLALCRKIAEHHGGRIWAESAGEGMGSRFCVELPQPQETST